jgi:hypothetical protein
MQGVRVAASSSINAIARGLTISAWASRAAPVGARYYSILSRQHGTTFRDAYNFTFHGSLLEAFLYVDTVHANVAATSTPTPASTWIHVACVFDGSTARLYIGGREVASRGMPGAINQVATNPIYIGVNVNTVWPPEPYAGKYDDVMLWSRALSAEQIDLLARGYAPALP